MLLTRESFETRENKILAPYAVRSAESHGREFKEPEDPYRTCFQRDRDRVIHSKAFRRLKGKTQVFIAHYGDHYRSRLTHTMEVAQLSRDLARMLNLNEDLAETIALAHDLGHTPFGHAGQDTVNELMREYGQSFEHNEQSRRVVEYLEEKSADYRGLNLTFEVRDGLIKHRTSFDQPVSLDVHMPSLEAQIVNMADEIAYLNHDIDDGLRAGILKKEALNDLAIWKKTQTNVNQTLPQPFLISAMISSLIGLMIHDLADNTDHLIASAGISDLESVYSHSKPLSTFSEGFKKECAELKDFLYEYFYRSNGVADYNIKGQNIIRFLFKKLMSNFQLLPEKIRQNPYGEESHVLVKDYIAGMTDQFALDLYDQLTK
ncbi:deoxyguanosinetriphosphate triphosphohydrolase [Candidatus Peregrinibacteria bacterium]|nr:deoxyguanosinetriphosphate triphosphohydrolase [Candidatus Peregrinibacteria bacterium]